MSDSIGRGTIEISADATKLKAGIEDAKRSIKGFGDAASNSTTAASRSIDRYIKRLETQNATFGKSAREAELYKLSLKGASAEQLKAADNALKLAEAQQKGAALGDTLRTGLIAAAAAAAAAGGALAVLVANSIDAADNLNDLSKKTGISVEQLSGLSLAAEQSGTDLEGVADAINKLSVNMAKDGERFKALGVDAKEPLEAFKQLADIFSQIEDPQTRAALGASALGKSWQSAAPLLSEGGKNIGEMVEKGMKLSGVTKEMAEEADKFNDSVAEMKQRTAGFGNEIAAAVLPGFNKVLGVIKDALEDSGKLQAIWVALGSVGALLYTNEFSGAKVQIADLQDELKDLEAYLTQSQTTPAFGVVERYLFAGSQETIIAKIAKTKAEIAALQRSLVAPPVQEATETPAQKAARERAKEETERRAREFASRNADQARKEAEERAKAQLDADIAGIKTRGAATLAALSDAEKILDARRSAGLVNDAEYYAAKQAFINLNGEAEQNALSQEIARYEKESAAGKAKLELDKKIIEAEGAKAKSRGEATTAAELNAIAEESANNRIAASYGIAKRAAQDYLASIKRENKREIDGIGKGDKFRTDQAQLGRMSDNRDEQKRGNEADRLSGRISTAEFEKYNALVEETYAGEVAAYASRNEEIAALQGDWMVGAEEAFANFATKAQDVAAQSAEAFSSVFEGLSEGIASSISRSLIYGESFKDSMINVAGSIADAFITSFIKIQIQKLLVDKASGALYAGTVAAQSQAQVAMAGLNAFASTAAIPIVGPALAPGAAAAAIAVGEGFAAAATAAAALSVAGGRALGGPVSAGQLYQVNERGPEMLSAGGKDYLMMGQKGGVVIPNNRLAQAGGGGQPTAQAGGEITYAPVIQIDSRSDQAQVRQLVSRAIQDGNADLVEKLQRSGRIA